MPSRPNPPCRFRVTVAVLLTSLTTLAARAEVAWLEVRQRDPFAAGHAFGATGAYEKITGHLHFQVDPLHPANSRIVDVKLAPRNSDGRVEFESDFFLLRPTDPMRGNGCLLYDVNNRGNKLILAALNEARTNEPTSLADAGNGFLMRRGFAILWTGWNGDVVPGDNRLTIDLPVAVQPDGDIIGRIYSEICASEKHFSEPLCWGPSRVYPSATANNAAAHLTMRPSRAQPEIEIPRDQWAFARWENGTAVPDPTCLYLRAGFRPGWLYDLVYVGRHPRVAGLGSAAVRDAVSFFRYAERDRRGLANPLAGGIRRACALGISQSARFLHHFIQEDFNGDENGRIVFEGVFAHVGGAGKGIFNARFAQITRHGSQHEENLYPTDTFPFNTLPQKDPLTGEEGDWLDRPRRPGHLPRLFITCTSTEYWNRAQSLVHTDVEGKHDVELDPAVRLYHIAGAHHLFSAPSNPGAFRYAVNSLDYRPTLRALLIALDQWIADGREPPPNRYPHIADGTLIDCRDYLKAFPPIPGLLLPESCYAPLRLDSGPRWQTEGIADFVPPRAGLPYRTLVPAIDADGNERGGIRLPDMAVPTATYVGWNLRDPSRGAERALARWEGSQWPFPQTRVEREKSGDPRRPITERYPSKEAYLGAIDQTARQLVTEGFLLEPDRDAILATATTRPFAPAASAPARP